MLKIMNRNPLTYIDQELDRRKPTNDISEYTDSVQPTPQVNILLNGARPRKSSDETSSGIGIPLDHRRYTRPLWFK
jgi:hypothetical protein